MQVQLEIPIGQLKKAVAEKRKVLRHYSGGMRDTACTISSLARYWNENEMQKRADYYVRDRQRIRYGKRKPIEVELMPSA